MMIRKTLCLSIALALFAGPAAAAGTKAAAARLTAEQVVEKHIQARGGLTAWHAIRTLSWSGKLDAGPGDSVSRSESYVSTAMTWRAKKAKILEQANAKAEPEKQVELPFVLDMKRPGMSRVEIEFAGKTAVQVYDGHQGWKVRPFLNRDDVEPFSPDEVKASEGKWQIDGPLLDYAEKGTRVELEGMEAVQGSDAYKLKLTARSGAVQHIWIDAKSFLDVKVEGTPRRMDGRMHSVWIYQRDFRQVDGVMVPYLLETAVDGYHDTHRMIIDKVAVNPVLSDALFAKPTPGGNNHG